MNTDQENQDLQRRRERLETLFWLSDAPLFIDRPLVERFFDAIVRPKYEHVGVTEERANESEEKILGALGLKGVAGLNLPEWLKPIKLEAEATGEISGEGKQIERSSKVSQLKPIWNAERQLEELARHYLERHRDRIVVGDAPLDSTHWPRDQKGYLADKSFLTRVPRALAFLDLAPKVQLIPTAAEFVDGAIVLLYDELVRQLTSENGGPMRRYPDDHEMATNELHERRKGYWASFQKYYNSKTAMIVLEEASSKHGRINWIDSQVSLDDEGSTLHLHIVPAGAADAGIFGYNFIRRGYKHGIRIVGTVKSEPDMNVLAIDDK